MRADFIFLSVKKIKSLYISPHGGIMNDYKVNRRVFFSIIEVWRLIFIYKFHSNFI